MRYINSRFTYLLTYLLPAHVCGQLHTLVDNSTLALITDWKNTIVNVLQDTFVDNSVLELTTGWRTMIVARLRIRIQHILLDNCINNRIARCSTFSRWTWRNGPRKYTSVCSTACNNLYITYFIVIINYNFIL